MSSYSSPAIMLRKKDFGDYDLIITLFTLKEGKITVIAKSAKKSTKRFGGILELFSALDVVYSIGQKKGLPILQEAALKQPFPSIRSSMLKTAYASYWTELINEWMENGQIDAILYQLFYHVLKKLDAGAAPEGALSILFQMRFMKMFGLAPNLQRCGICRTDIEKIKETKVIFNLAKGAIICSQCAAESGRKFTLTKGTVKQLLWIEKEHLEQAARIWLDSETIKVGEELLEAFVPFHLGKDLRSLKFLRQIRK
ncbi:MAG: DNA repair protein RecO [Desulfobacterales bacterium]